MDSGSLKGVKATKIVVTDGLRFNQIEIPKPPTETEQGLPYNPASTTTFWRYLYKLNSKVLMRSQNLCLYTELTKITIELSGLQIRRSNKDNLGIIGHISSEKHIL